MICNCNMAWGSILPPPPCPTHGRVTYNFIYEPEASPRTYDIREERYFAVDRDGETMGTFDTLREAEAVRDALKALDK